MGHGEMQDMLIEYMGKGFLENIISLFRTDPSLFVHVPAMLGHENMRVRLGTAALIEEFTPTHHRELADVLPGVIALLRHEDPVIRGDAAYVLGILRDRRAVGPLREALNDPDPAVRQSMKDALEEIIAGSEQASDARRDQDADDRNHAGDADGGDEGGEGLPEGRERRRSDGPDIHQDAEAEAEEEKTELDHG